MAPEGVAEQVDLFKAEVIDEFLDVLGQRLGTGGRERQVIQRQHRDDDPHFPCEVGKEVLEVAERPEKSVEQHEGRPLFRALDIAKIAGSNEVLFHGLVQQRKGHGVPSGRIRDRSMK